jgi:hypothetical protein
VARQAVAVPTGVCHLMRARKISGIALQKQAITTRDQVQWEQARLRRGMGPTMPVVVQAQRGRWMVMIGTNGSGSKLRGRERRVQIAREYVKLTYIRST